MLGMAPALRRLRESGCTVVMSTGILSVDLHARGWLAPSRVLLAVAAALWLALALSAGLAGSVAGVPATSVLGTRLSLAGHPRLAEVLLGIAVLLFAHHARRIRVPARAGGSDLLPSVAAQSLAVLCGALAGRLPWLRPAGAVALAAGVALYAATLARFDTRALARGGGDQWIAGGALAIACLASAQLTHDALAVMGLWIAALAWLPALAGGELARPRAGDPDRRWSTVFPLGMYAACSFAVAPSLATTVPHVVADVLTPVALTAWALVLVRRLAAGWEEMRRR
jgi:hypothetical protein